MKKTTTTTYVLDTVRAGAIECIAEERAAVVLVVRTRGFTRLPASIRETTN